MPAPTSNLNQLPASPLLASSGIGITSSSDNSTFSLQNLRLDSTHDVSSAGAHVPNIEKFAKDVQSSYEARKRSSSEYDSVHVLFLSWQEDDLGVDTEIEQLRRVFDEFYHFQVEEPWKIPSKSSNLQLSKRVTDFLTLHEAKQNLLIVYYAGHGGLGARCSDPPIWAANQSSQTPTAPSSGVQGLLESSESDVLLLIDSCHSAHPSVSLGEGRGVTQVIAACGFETWAPAVGEHSFTKALTTELAKAAEDSPFDVAQLYDRVLWNVKSWDPQPKRDTNGFFIRDSNGRIKMEKNSRKTPVHGFLTNETLRRIILLAPLLLEPTQKASTTDSGDRVAEAVDSGDHGLRSPPPTPPIVLRDELEITSYNAPSVSKSPMILMAISVANSPLVHDAWVAWLRCAPSAVNDIKLEAAYRSFSTIFIVKMPINVWVLLEPNPAYSFIGFANSNNLVTASKELPDPKLSQATRPLGQEGPNKEDLGRTESVIATVYPQTKGPIELPNKSEQKSGALPLNPDTMTSKNQSTGDKYTREKLNQPTKQGSTYRSSNFSLGGETLVQEEERSSDLAQKLKVMSRKFDDVEYEKERLGAKIQQSRQIIERRDQKIHEQGQLLENQWQQLRKQKTNIQEMDLDIKVLEEELALLEDLISKRTGRLMRRTSFNNGHPQGHNVYRGPERSRIARLDDTIPIIYRDSDTRPSRYINNPFTEFERRQDNMDGYGSERARWKEPDSRRQEFARDENTSRYRDDVTHGAPSYGEEHRYTEAYRHYSSDFDSLKRPVVRSRTWVTEEP